MQLCLFQSAHVNMNMNVTSVNHSWRYVCVDIYTVAQLRPVTVESMKKKNPAEFVLHLKIFVTALEGTDEEVQNSSHIKPLDMKKSILTL